MRKSTPRMIPVIFRKRFPIFMSVGASVERRVPEGPLYKQVGVGAHGREPRYSSSDGPQGSASES